MKRVISILVLTLAGIMSATSFAQAPPPPQPGFSPWGSPWSGNPVAPGTPPPPPGIGTNLPPLNDPNWQNAGRMTVIGCGYDAQGVWRTIPMRVSYTYNGMQYQVTVLNAWNPWSQTWDYGVDVPAVNTSYFINGNTYNFYVVLSTGTFYFNL